MKFWFCAPFHTRPISIHKLHFYPQDSMKQNLSTAYRSDTIPVGERCPKSAYGLRVELLSTEYNFYPHKYISVHKSLWGVSCRQFIMCTSSIDNRKTTEPIYKSQVNYFPQKMNFYPQNWIFIHNNRFLSTKCYKIYHIDKLSCVHNFSITQRLQNLFRSIWWIIFHTNEFLSTQIYFCPQNLIKCALFDNLSCIRHPSTT